MRAIILAALSLILSATGLAAQPPETGSDPQPLVMGETHSLPSQVMGENRRITVRVPAGYAAEPTRRYGVVYVIDGGPEQDFPHLAGLAQSAEVNGTFEPFILVGIETVKRREEITPPVKNPAPYVAELQAMPGRSAQFRRFMPRRSSRGSRRATAPRVTMR